MFGASSAKRQAVGLLNPDGESSLSPMPDDPIQSEGIINAVLGSDYAEVMLPNGKLTIGHLSKALREQQAELRTGLKVGLELTAFDLDKARIVSIADSN